MKPLGSFWVYVCKIGICGPDACWNSFPLSFLGEIFSGKTANRGMFAVGGFLTFLKIDLNSGFTMNSSDQFLINSLKKALIQSGKLRWRFSH